MLDLLRSYRAGLPTTEPLALGVYGEVLEPGVSAPATRSRWCEPAGNLLAVRKRRATAVLVVAVVVVGAFLLLRGGGSGGNDANAVRATLAGYASATAAKDYTTICRRYPRPEPARQAALDPPALPVGSGPQLAGRRPGADPDRQERHDHRDDGPGRRPQHGGQPAPARRDVRARQGRGALAHPVPGHAGPQALRPQRVVAFAPGRVNLIGEHTDYNDGLALAFAVADGVTVTASARDGDEIEAVAADADEFDRFPLDRPPRGAGGWRSYVRGMVAELQAAGHELRAARLHITGTVPAGSGLSSSAALEVAIGLALLGLAGVSEPTASSSPGCARASSTTGSAWPVACSTRWRRSSARPGRPCGSTSRTLERRPVALALGDWSLVIVDSGEAHALAESGYNDRRAECERARDLLGLTSLRDAAAADLPRLPRPLDARVRHVIQENARVDAMIAALDRGDLGAAGRLLDASHASLRDLYATSTDRVEQTVAECTAAGAAGARMVGGGFGGHVLALFPPGVRPARGRVVAAAGGARLVTPGSRAST